jgi:hypothetical protein
VVDVDESSAYFKIKTSRESGTRVIAEYSYPCENTGRQLLHREALTAVEGSVGQSKRDLLPLNNEIESMGLKMNVDAGEMKSYLYSV